MKKRKEMIAQTNLLHFLGKKQPCMYQETNEILGFDWQNESFPNNQDGLQDGLQNGQDGQNGLQNEIQDKLQDKLNKKKKEEALFEIKHCPLKEEEILGKAELSFAIQSIKEWKKGKWKHKPLFLCGPSGTGKSMLIKVFMKEFTLWDESMLQEEDSLIDSIKHMLEKKPLFSVQRCIVIDCLDGLQTSEINSLLNLVKKTKEFFFPFILTCDDDMDLKDGKQWKQLCNFIKFQKHTKSTFSDIIQNVTTKENLKIPQTMLENLYEHSFGNVRFALHELEFLLKTRKRKITENSSSSLASKDKISNVWDTTQKLFLGVSVDSNELEAFDGDSFFPKLLYENATHISDFSYWDVLSQADVLEHKHGGLCLQMLALGTQCYGKKMKFHSARKLNFPGIFEMEKKKYKNEKLKIKDFKIEFNS